MYNNYYQQPYMMPNQNAYGGMASQQFLTPNQPQLKGRPVSSIEEARAAQIDFDGSIFIFPDTANKKIYTKCINMDGTSSLNVFELTEAPTSQSLNNYITREEMEKTIEELKQSFIILMEQNRKSEIPNF